MIFKSIYRCIFLVICFCFDVLCAQTTSIKADGNVAKWMKLASDYRYVNPDSARYYAQLILKSQNKKDENALVAEALRIISISYESQGDYKDALNYGLQSLKLWRQIGDEKKMANTINAVGIIYDQQGQFYEALKYYNEAYDIYKKLGDEENLAMMDVNLGILFKAQGQYKQVIEHYQAAYRTYKKLKLPEEMAFCEANLGSIYYYTKQYDSCVYYSKKAEIALQKLNNLQFLPVAQANAGLGLLEQNKLSEANFYLNKALKTHREFKNKKEIAFVLIHLARLYQKLGNTTKFYQALSEAKSIAKQINSPQQQIDASKLFAEYYANNNDFENAYFEYVNYSSLKDTLFEQEKSKEIANHQVKYETQRKEQEIELLTQQNQINELAIKQRNLYLIIALLLVLITSFIAWFVHQSRKLKEKQLKKDAEMQAELLRLEAQNELQKDRLRISRDLHDNIGANLTYIQTTVNHLQVDDKNLSDVQSLVNETIGELRRTVWMINKPEVSIGEWIIKLREYYNRIPYIKISSSITSNIENKILTSKQATALFRIIQEATNNSLKYSKSDELKVDLSFQEDNLFIEIKDKGIGFNQNKKSQGFGLNNMQQHAHEIGAVFSLKSKINQGTQINVKIAVL